MSRITKALDKIAWHITETGDPYPVEQLTAYISKVRAAHEARAKKRRHRTAILRETIRQADELLALYPTLSDDQRLTNTLTAREILANGRAGGRTCINCGKPGSFAVWDYGTQSLCDECDSNILAMRLDDARLDTDINNELKRAIHDIAECLGTHANLVQKALAIATNTLRDHPLPSE